MCGGVEQRTSYSSRDDWRGRCRGRHRRWGHSTAHWCHPGAIHRHRCSHLFASAHEVGLRPPQRRRIDLRWRRTPQASYGLGGWRRPQGWLWLSRVRGPWPQPAAWPRVSCNCKTKRAGQSERGKQNLKATFTNYPLELDKSQR